MTITEHTPVGDIAAALPSSVRVFQQHGIDFCCGGRKTLGDVCDERGLSFPEITRAIDVASAGPAPERDWTHAPLSSLIRHIIATYHDPLRTELPRLQQLAAKAYAVHGARAPHLEHVEHLLSALAADLTTHMQKEEQVLFPAIQRVEAGVEPNPAWILAPMSVMEHEHEDAGALLGDLRGLTDNYVPPVWACGTIRALYKGLDELEHGMHLHVNLENHVLFPRAIDQARAAQT